MISAEVVADSVAVDTGLRITTQLLVYPKYIHGDLMTHRAFSRSARSSRAVPVEKILREVSDNPVEPIQYLKNQRGMQAAEPLSPADSIAAQEIWRSMARDVSGSCRKLSELGLHKQWANRPTEAFTVIFTLVTSVYWKNFYGLRRHSAAQPEIIDLANKAYAAHKASIPVPLAPGNWHLPYIDPYDAEFVAEVDDYGDRLVRAGKPLRDSGIWSPNDVYEATSQSLLRRISAARSARTSYMTFDNRKPEVHEDIDLFGKLMGSQPLHASPAEHQATPDTWNGEVNFKEVMRIINGHRPQDRGEVMFRSVLPKWESPWLWGNFYGWNQFRKTLPLEDGSGFECDIEGVL